MRVAYHQRPCAAHSNPSPSVLQDLPWLCLKRLLHHLWVWLHFVYRQFACLQAAGRMWGKKVGTWEAVLVFGEERANALNLSFIILFAQDPYQIVSSNFQLSLACMREFDLPERFFFAKCTVHPQGNRCGNTGHLVFYPGTWPFYHGKLYLLGLTDISPGKFPWIRKKDRMKRPRHLTW